MEQRVLELSLIETVSSDSIKGTLLKRERFQLPQEVTADVLVNTAVEFLKRSSDTLELALPNKEALTSLNLKGDQYTPTDLFCFKLLLTRSGLDLEMLVFEGESVLNANEIPADMSEINLVDKLNVVGGFVPTAMRLNYPQDSDIALSAFDELYGEFEPFGKGMIDRDVILGSQIDLLKQNAELVGKFSNGIAYSVSYIYEYLGKEIRVINGN